MYTIFGFYKFKQLKKISRLKDKLQNFIDDYKIKGTIIISPEGINGSISFLKKNTKQIKINLKKIFAITKFDNENISFNRFIPFHKGRVKVKKEVVPIGKRLKKKVKYNESGNFSRWIRYQNKRRNSPKAKTNDRDWW